MSAIFISHSSRDNEFCKRLVAWLETLGHRSLFLDFDASTGIEGGCNWEQTLYRKLRVCRALIVVCTEHSMQSKWCFAEITQARSLGKQIFPLRVAPCDVDAVLSDSQIVDFVTLGEKDAFDRLKRGLSVAGIDADDPSDWDGSRPPYPGLLALQEQDAAMFFGRDAEIGEGLDVLNRTHRFGGAGLVMILGASGSGKSSLVRAGLIPRLKRDPERWLVVRPFRPGEDPFSALAEVLAEACREHATAPPANLSAQLSNVGGADSLVDVAQNLRLASGRENASVLLVIDQFEELLGRHADHPATQFLSSLRATMDGNNSSIVFLGTMRSDFFAAFQENAALTGLEFGRILLGPMPAASLTDVIVKPAERAGVRLEPGLVQSLIDDTRTDGALPLLAFTMRELYDKYIEDGLIELREYRDLLGGLKGALAKAADGVLNHPPLSPEAEVELRNAFLRMARLDDEGHYARQVVRWSDVPTSVHPVLRRLVDRRLLVSDGSEGEAGTLEVAHEALFRSWDKLTGWLEEDREFLLWRRRVADARKEWERAARDDGSLLRGPVLGEAERWLADRPDDLAEAERGFIVASAALRQRRKIRAAGAGLAFVLVLLLGGYEWRSVQRRAELEARFRETVATDVRTSYRTFDTLYRTYGKIRPGVLTAAVLDHGASLFAEGPLAGDSVQAVEGSVELDIIEREHPAFMGSLPAFGAIAYRLEDIVARNDSLRERARRLRETVRGAFITRQNLIQPTAAEDESLNRRIQIAAGSFVMGSPEGVGDDDEHPAHRVHLGAFSIQEHEVTNAEYRRFVSTHSFPTGEERHPVVNVTWYAAMAYAAWLGGSLPTEAQWEFAARGPKGRAYPWGLEPPTCTRAQFKDCAPAGTVEVKSATRGATPEGVYDLAGNVWEWVSDRYGEYSGKEVTDPRGPEAGSPTRVYRGGSFHGPPQFLRGAYRSYPPEGVALYVGFRVVWVSAGGQH